jgi:hypothetical protein
VEPGEHAAALLERHRAVYRLGGDAFAGEFGGEGMGGGDGGGECDPEPVFRVPPVGFRGGVEGVAAFKFGADRRVGVVPSPDAHVAEVEVGADLEGVDVAKVAFGDHLDDAALVGDFLPHVAEAGLVGAAGGRREPGCQRAPLVHAAEAVENAEVGVCDGVVRLVDDHCANSPSRSRRPGRDRVGTEATMT